MGRLSMRMVCIVCALFLVITIHIQLSQMESQAQAVPAVMSGNTPQMVYMMGYNYNESFAALDDEDEDEDEEVSCDNVFCFEDFEVLGPCEFAEEAPWDLSSPTNYAGGDVPEALVTNIGWVGGERMGVYNVNTSSVLSGCCLYLQFKQAFDLPIGVGGVWQLNVYARDSIGSSFQQIHNQIVTDDVPPEIITIDITPYIGTGTAIEWELLGEPYFNYWAIDDVMIYSADCAM